MRELGTATASFISLLLIAKRNVDFFLFSLTNEMQEFYRVVCGQSPYRAHL